MVNRRARSAVWLRDYAEPRIREPRKQGHRIVGGSVVDNDDFKVSVGLTENASDALLNVLSKVEARDNDSDEIFHGMTARALRRPAQGRRNSFRIDSMHPGCGAKAGGYSWRGPDFFI